MPLLDIKVFSLEDITVEAGLTTSEYSVIKSDIQSYGVIMDNPFKLHCDMRESDRESYDQHWVKLYDCLRDKYQVVFNEVVILM